MLAIVFAALAFVIILTFVYPGNFINLDYMFMILSGRLLFLMDNPQKQTKTELWKYLSQLRELWKSIISKNTIYIYRERILYIYIYTHTNTHHIYIYRERERERETILVLYLSFCSGPLTNLLWTVIMKHKPACVCGVRSWRIRVHLGEMECPV